MCNIADVLEVFGFMQPLRKPPLGIRLRTVVEGHLRLRNVLGDNHDLTREEPPFFKCVIGSTFVTVAKEVGAVEHTTTKEKGRRIDGAPQLHLLRGTSTMLYTQFGDFPGREEVTADDEVDFTGLDHVLQPFKTLSFEVHGGGRGVSR